jgi:uncharacterized Fe-S cluster protein YjdI
MSRSEVKNSVEGKSFIRVTENGPYELCGDAVFVDYLGVPIAHEEVARLCRCGQAKTKPFCDDACRTNGFTGATDPRRVPDRLDVYEGEQLTIYDNRGICAHSGFCTDVVPGVFHVGQEPFITPSGARADDILRAVRRCPSGASLFIVARDDANEDGPRLPRIQEQYQKAPEPKTLIILDGSAHAQFLFQTDQAERVMREILRFLSAK